MPRRLAICLLTAGLAVSACSSSGQPVDRSPLPATAPSGAQECGFLSQASVTTAVGTDKFTAAGSKGVLPGGRNPDGTALAQATCSVEDDQASTGALSVEALPVGADPARDRDIVATARSGKAAFVFPTAEGVGYGATSPGTDAANHPVTSATAVLLRGDWRVVVSIPVPAKGRDGVADCVAIVREVVQTLGLPARAPSTPYPTPS